MTLAHVASVAGSAAIFILSIVVIRASFAKARPQLHAMFGPPLASSAFSATKEATPCPVADRKVGDGAFEGAR